MTTTVLPAADAAEVRQAALGELRADRRAVAMILLLNVLSVAAGLVGPRLVGSIVDAVNDRQASTPTSALVAHVDHLAFAILSFTIAQIILARFALYMGSRFGERTAARIRERFLARTLALPASAVEHAAVGDLVTRGTNDVITVAATLRNALPEVVIALIQILFLIGAVLVLNPLLGASGLATLAVATFMIRWYLRRARAAYLAEGAANSAIAEVISTTAAGARTVETLGLQRRRVETAEAAISSARAARMRTLWLRTVLWPTVGASYVLPLVGVLLIGGVLYDRGAVTLGAVVASLLYLRQMAGPVDVLLIWLEQIQSSSASFARIEGITALSEAPSWTADEPADDRIEVSDISYAYGSGRDVLHGVSLDVRPGERLAVVGPSGAGKSTLGRLLAGIDRPRTGRVTVGGVPVADLAPDRLRRQIMLVTQEHHVFHDTVRHNLLIAKPDATNSEIRSALTTVDAAWIDDLPDGLDTEIGGNGHRLDGAQAQQLALARIVLADPHTLILDEATALLDPTTARNTERALAALLHGRTVIAIAHRLQTAHDADRVAVMADGVIAESGTHDELVAAGGTYAALWRSWHGDRA